MSAKSDALKAIAAIGRKTVSKARALASKGKASSKLAAAAVAGAVGDEFAKIVIDAKDQARKAIQTLRETATEVASAEIEAERDRQLAKIQTKAEAAIGRIKLIAEERNNASLDRASSGFFGASEARINSIVLSATQKLDPSQAQIVEQYARRTLGSIQEKVSASLISEIDLTGTIEGSIARASEKASAEAAKAASEAIVELALKEARQVDVSSVRPDEEVPSELKKKSTKSLRALLRNMEQGDFRTRWTPGQVKGALQSRGSL